MAFWDNQVQFCMQGSYSNIKHQSWYIISNDCIRTAWDFRMSHVRSLCRSRGGQNYDTYYATINILVSFIFVTSWDYSWVVLQEKVQGAVIFYNNDYPPLVYFPTPDRLWNGRYSWLLSEKVIPPSLSVHLLKIEPDYFPEGKRLRCRGPRSGDVDMSGYRWVQDCGMKSRGHQPRLLCSALPSLTAITAVCLCYCARGFLVFVFWLDLYFLYRVEFQNKFYSGQGFKFLPFTFESILDGRFEDWDLTTPLPLLMSLISWESVWCWIVIFVCDAVSDFPGVTTSTRVALHKIISVRLPFILIFSSL